MRKSILIAVTLGVFISCQSEYDKNMGKMTDSLKQYLDDAAFKENSTIDYLIFEPLGYDTVTNIEYYYKLLSLYNIEYQRHINVVNINDLKIKKEFDMIKLASLIGDKQEIEDSKSKAEELIAKNEIEVEILANIKAKVDSLLSLSSEIGDQGEMYKLNVFVKSIFKDKKGETENVMDTISALFDTGLQMIVMPDVGIDSESY